MLIKCNRYWDLFPSLVQALPTATLFGGHYYKHWAADNSYCFNSQASQKDLKTLPFPAHIFLKSWHILISHGPSLELDKNIGASDGFLFMLMDVFFCICHNHCHFSSQFPLKPKIQLLWSKFHYIYNTSKVGLYVRSSGHWMELFFLYLRSLFSIGRFWSTFHFISKLF